MSFVYLWGFVCLFVCFCFPPEFQSLPVRKLCLSIPQAVNRGQIWSRVCRVQDSSHWKTALTSPRQTGLALNWLKKKRYFTSPPDLLQGSYSAKHWSTSANLGLHLIPLTSLGLFRCLTLCIWLNILMDWHLLPLKHFKSSQNDILNWWETECTNIFSSMKNNLKWFLKFSPSSLKDVKLL